MNNKIINEKCHGSIKYLVGVLTVLFAVLAVSEFVGMENKIKEGRYIGADIETKNTITVSDSSEIFAKPDLAVVNFSVVSEKKTVIEAMEENTKAMNGIVKAMKNKGVEEKDLKTTNFSIYPRYEYDKRAEVYSYPYPEGKRILVGYEVRQSLEVKIRDLAKIGGLIGAATEAGANEIGDLRFTIDKEDELKKQARTEAIKKAKEKAEELAKELGLRLVRVVNFSDADFAPVYYDYLKAEASGMGGGGAATPQIETGENVIRSTVSITYEIR